MSCPFSGSRSFWGRTGLTVVLVLRAQNPPGGTLPFLLEPSPLSPPLPPLRLSKAWRSHLASPPFQYNVIHTVMSASLQSLGLYPDRRLCPWNPPCKNTGRGSQSLLQGIFQTKGSNPGLLQSRKILYPLSHPGS